MACGLIPLTIKKSICNSANSSSNEIYSYPAWVIKDGQGNLIAEEQVMYFGIAGTSFHVFDDRAMAPGGHFQLTSHWNCGLLLTNGMHLGLDFPSAGIALDWERGWRVFPILMSAYDTGCHPQ